MRRLIYFVLAFVIWILLTWPFGDGKIDIQVVIAGLIGISRIYFTGADVLALGLCAGILLLCNKG
jgi:hypothetical protein